MTILELAINNYPELWNKNMVRKLVERGRISEDEYLEITGEIY